MSRVFAAFLVAAFTANAVVAEEFRYEFEGASLTIEEDFHDCGRAAKGELRHPYPGLHDDPAGLQRIVRALAELRRADCGLTNVLDLRLYGTEHVSEITVLGSDFWQLDALRRPEAETAAEAAAGAARLAEIMAAPVVDDHPLAYRGWARSELLYAEDAFRLYAAFASRENDRAELVMVFADTPGQPFFPTALQQMERNNITVVPGAEYFAMLDRAMAEAGPPYWQGNEIQHYLSGYYAPEDREAILSGDGVVETAFHRMNYGRYWDGERMRVTPIPFMYLGYEAAPEELLIDRERIEIRFGPSAPGPEGVAVAAVAELAEVPSDGYLPEGPSPKRLYQRRAVREATIEQGLIFLNDGFWARFSSSDVQRIFEAHADYLAVGDPGFSTLLMHYLDQNARQCRHLIEKPVAWQLKEITVSVDGWGNSSKSENVIWDLIVPARFMPHLETRFNAPGPTAGETLEFSLDLMRPGGLGGLAGDIARDRQEIEESIEDIKKIMALGDCGNAFHVQFEEMLYLHLAELNPETHTTLTFAEGDRVTMDLFEPGTAERLKTACLAADDFLGKRDDWRRCGCIENKLDAYLPDRVGLYTERFQRLWPDVRDIREKPSPRNAADRALLSVWNECL
ncbi:hypothetical protein AAFO92_03850 [Roseovarius sp. CAU 1744]|uniref:hypothetical protein n=1 Tax=Roseovarius sp. CAU 1744 TaxID=3140368 RepID=UPI00325A840E